MFVEDVYTRVKAEDLPCSKYASLFKNFDPEKLTVKENREEFLDAFGNEFLLIVRKGIKICSYLILSDEKKIRLKRHYLNNYEFRYVANNVHKCYFIGNRICSGEFIRWTSMHFDDWDTYIDTAKDGYTDQKPRGIRPAQVIGVCVLLMIDFALSDIRKRGFQKQNMNSILMAYRYLLDAERNDAELMRHHLERVKSSTVARSGGDGRAALFTILEKETIRLYELDKARWPTGRHHVPTAALEITPKIVAFSKSRGDLLSTTTKPLEWIRAHVKRTQSQLS